MYIKIVLVNICLNVDDVAKSEPFFFFFDKKIEILLMINTNYTVYPNRDITESLDLDLQPED